MSRLAFFGGETAHEHAEGVTLAGTTLAFDTAVKRSGTHSYRFTSSAANTVFWAFTGATARRYWAQAYIYLPAASGLPGGNSRILAFQTAAAGALCSVNLTTGGKLQLLNQAGTQIGSDSAATLVADTWYRVALGVEIAAGANDFAELQLDGVSVASTTTGAFSDTAPGRLYWGWLDDPGTSEVLHVDDIVLNDDQGSVHNDWPGQDKVVLLLPISDNTINNWRQVDGGSNDLWDALNNTPPVGLENSAGNDTSQMENTVSAANNPYLGNMSTYTTAGIVAGDTVTAIFAVAEASEDSTTGADTVDIAVDSNPAIAAVEFSCDFNDSTYPTGWNRGQTLIAENPTVALGTSPVARIEKNVATTRDHQCCLLAMYVSYTEAPTGGRGPQVIWIL